jgi:zinc transport system ATP-binding protein
MNSDGITIIMISHDIAYAVKDASHVLHLGNQKKMFYGTKTAYLTSEIGRFYGGNGGDGDA